MNTNATETTASILEEMRKGDKCDFPFAYRFAYGDAPAVVDVTTKDILEPAEVRIIKVTIDELADRLEKAIARETKNTAAMYEALEAFVQLANDGVIQPRTYGEAEHHCFCALHKQVAAALSAPIRNCDKGTWEEQLQRFMKWCVSAGQKQNDCFNKSITCNKCFAKWMNEPYESGCHLIKDTEGKD